ncbi:MAG: ABC transporter ATP-binding protein [Candidatus Azotimanducaceae bacterium]
MKSLTKLVPLLRNYKGQVFLGLFAFFVARFFEICTYYLASLGIDLIGDLYQGINNLSFTITELVLALIATVVLRFFIVSAARRAIRRVGIAVAHDLRQDLYRSVLAQGPTFFSAFSVGDIMTRAIQDISLVQRLVSFGFIALVIMVYAPLFGVGAMLMKSVPLTLLVVPLLPVIFVYTLKMAREMGNSSREVQNKLSQLSSHTQENLSGIRTVQAGVQEKNESDRFWKTNDGYALSFFEQARINSLMSAWLPFFASLAQLVIVLYGGHLVIKGDMSVGDLVFFFACLSMLLAPIKMAGFLVMLVQRAAVASDRIFEIIEADPEVKDKPSGETPDRMSGKILIKDLNFSYRNRAAFNLRGISIEAQAGEWLGVVGKVGAGKSTLLKMLTRLLSVPPGSVFLDGHEIFSYPLGQLRKEVVFVMQDSFLFDEPIFSNISYDKPDRDIGEVWKAADSAKISDSIAGFPKKMQTVVGERGVTLSGGQKQRTTLARGFVRDASILILDDCFSSVDTETEEHILLQLKELRKNKTTIIVSHRVSTLRHADRIIYMEDGAVKENGSHTELINKRGSYYKLEKAQNLSDDAVAELT